MDENDISVIFPVTGEQKRNIQSPFNNYPDISEGSEEYKVIPSSIPTLYFGKKTMRQLLIERTLVCDFLKIKLKSNSSNKGSSMQAKDKYLIISQLFTECPTRIDEANFVFIQDCGTSYGFFSTDGKFVPLCKNCNFTVYIVLRQNKIKVLCSNSKCKIKILAQTSFSMEQKYKKVDNKQSSDINSKIKQQNKKELTKDRNISNNQRKLTKEEQLLIKKTAKKILQL